ncbi:hypothetical protein Tco_1474628 [Tanacetum coccineum]
MRKQLCSYKKAEEEENRHHPPKLNKEYIVLYEKVEAEVDDAKEDKELKQCLEIVPDDGDDVTIDATPFSIKIPIVEYKIYQEGKKSFFKIIRADGKTQMYLTSTKMLKIFNREDLEVIWRIVKARFKKTEPVNYMDIFLHLNLKTMFEHHVEDSIWKNQQGLVKVLNWKLFDSCGVHCMFNNVKLQVDYECEMAYELLRLVKKQLKEGYGRIVGIKSLLEVTAVKGFVVALAVLVTGASQSRQHESRKSPTTELFDVDSGRISIHHCEY